MKIPLPDALALVGLAISFALPTFAQQKEPTPSESTPEATPTPTSVTQILPDRRITFRLSAPYANAVQVLMGVKSRVLEGQGATTTDMTKDLGLWSALWALLNRISMNIFSKSMRFR
jgi:hypothetical protein